GWEILLLAILAPARDRRVKAAEWRDWLHRIIRTKSQGHAFIQKGQPGIGSCRLLRAQPILGPAHIRQQTTGLHRSNHLQRLELGNLLRSCHLRMLDAQTEFTASIGSSYMRLSRRRLGTG